MSTLIQIKRGPTDPSGITTGEFAYNTTDSKLFIGGTAERKWIGGEVTGGVDMGGGSAVSQNRVPTQNGVYQYTRNNFVGSFNGLTGAVTGASLGANTFTGLQTLTGGLCAAGGVTFNSSVYATGTVVGASGVAIGSDAISQKTSGYTLTAADNGKVLTFSGKGSLVVGIDTSTGATGYTCTVIQLDTGDVRFSGSGVNLNFFSGLTLAGQHAVARVICYATNTYNISGDTVP